MNKDYNRVYWLFLKAVHLKSGFNALWCNLIHECISSCTMRVLFNGTPLPAFSPGKGLCQVDPLSPYLFILVSECLSILIDNASTDGVFQAIKLSKVWSSYLP